MENTNNKQGWEEEFYNEFVYDGEWGKADPDTMKAFISKTIESERESKDRAYDERNNLVAFLSRLYPSHLCKHPDEDVTWEDDWRWIVCIHSPAGQLTWHLQDSHLEKFSHLVKNQNHWDGHTNEEKYKRLSHLPEVNL